MGQHLPRLPDVQGADVSRRSGYGRGAGNNDRGGTGRGASLHLANSIGTPENVLFRQNARVAEPTVQALTVVKDCGRCTMTVPQAAVRTGDFDSTCTVRHNARKPK